MRAADVPWQPMAAIGHQDQAAVCPSRWGRSTPFESWKSLLWLLTTLPLSYTHPALPPSAGATGSSFSTSSQKTIWYPHGLPIRWIFDESSMASRIRLASWWGICPDPPEVQLTSCLSKSTVNLNDTNHDETCIDSFWFIVWLLYAFLKFNSSPLKSHLPNRNGTSSNHHFFRGLCSTSGGALLQYTSFNASPRLYCLCHATKALRTHLAPSRQPLRCAAEALVPWWSSSKDFGDVSFC